VSPEGKIERVRPQDIKTTALLTIEGELDDISGSGQTEAAHSLCSSIAKTQQKHFEVPGAGHYGIFSGRRWRDVTYPVVHGFILAANTLPVKKMPANKPAAQQNVAQAATKKVATKAVAKAKTKVLAQAAPKAKAPVRSAKRKA
jgi:poly(3-hydroxybutyrate) depolymerase